MRSNTMGKIRKPTPAKSEPSANEKIYSAYVRGTSIADLAVEFSLEPAEVLDIINKIEQARA